MAACVGCGRGQEFSFCVVPFEPFAGKGAVLHRIAVDAAHRTAVVGADIARGRAQAPWAIALLDRGDRAPGNLAEPCGIDATGRTCARRQILGLGTEREPHPRAAGEVRKLCEELPLFPVFRIAPVEPEGPRRRRHVAPGLAINLREGDNHLVRRPLEGPGQGREILLVPGKGCQGRHGDGVVAPHACPRSVGGGDLEHVRDGSLGFGGGILQRPGVAVEGGVHDEGKAPVADGGQVLEEWPRVLGPEHETVDGFGGQRDLVDLEPVWIRHAAKSRVQARHEPGAVEGRDVGPV